MCCGNDFGWLYVVLVVLIVVCYFVDWFCLFGGWFFSVGKLCGYWVVVVLCVLGGLLGGLIDCLSDGGCVL